MSRDELSKGIGWDIGGSEISQTITFTACPHEYNSFRSVRVRFLLFEIIIDYKVCHKCYDIIESKNKRKFKWL